MTLGAAFVNAARGVVLSHLWFVVSNPTGANRIAVVNLSSDDDGYPDLPMVGRSFHPWLRHESHVRAHQARLADLKALKQTADRGLLHWKDSLTTDKLTELQGLLARCRHTPRAVRITLEEQGFITAW